MRHQPMHAARLLRLLPVLVALVLPACSDTSGPGAAAQVPALAEASTPVDPHGSCRLVSAAEMSAILGRQVTARQEPFDGGHSNCAYYDTAGSRVFTLILEPDSLDMASRSVDTPLHHGPATASQPYADIGDQVGQAFQGRMLVVAIGNDLLNFDLTRMTGDKPATIRRIVDTAAPRLRH